MNSKSPVLQVVDLHVSVGNQEILKGISLSVDRGERVAIMGPNGSGKSTLANVIMGKPGYEITRGEILFDGVSLNRYSAFERARMGLSLVSQYPQEVEGVNLSDLVGASLQARGLEVKGLEVMIREEADKVGFSPDLLDRWVNVDLSGGEKKRLETIILSLIPSKLAILDEVDSGLDIDALRQVSRRVNRLSEQSETAVLAVTHYARLLRELVVERVLVLAKGGIVLEGGPELADHLEVTGYREIVGTQEEEVSVTDKDFIF